MSLPTPLVNLLRVGMVRRFHKKVVLVRNILVPTPRFLEIGKRMVDRIPRSRWVMYVWLETKA